MSLQRLIVSAEQIVDQQLWLRSPQQHYLTRVLRLQAGGEFVVLDGQGGVWQAVLEPSLSSARLQPIAEDAAPAPTVILPAVTLLAAIPKQGFDDVVRQATELGVAAIVPVLSERTLPHPGQNKVTRWRRIVQEAAEQCERLQVPNLVEPLPLAQALQLGQTVEQRYFCATRLPVPPLLRCVQQARISAPIAAAPRSEPSMIVAIGPEGGWSEAEVELALAADYQLVSLGPLVLRAVTASIAALAGVIGVYTAGLGE